MPRQQQRSAWLAALTALAFLAFFQVSKHQPAFASINPFADDPYDAVGSFATQFALVAALVAVLRAFRPYRASVASDASSAVVMPAAQEHFLARAVALVSLAVLVTMASNAVALARHPDGWLTFPGGRLLAGLVAGMSVLALLTLWSALAPRLRIGAVRPSSTSRVAALVVSLLALVLLAVYPEAWTQQVPTEVLTIAVGILILFVPLWALDRALFTAPPANFADTIDDLMAIVGWLRARVPGVGILLSLLSVLARLAGVRTLIRWLNPRRYPWVPLVLLGLLMGAWLLEAEALGEGGLTSQPGVRLLLIGIFLGMECFAVLVGYALLACPLGLFRRELLPPRSRVAEVRALNP